MNNLWFLFSWDASLMNHRKGIIFWTSNMSKLSSTVQQSKTQKILSASHSAAKIKKGWRIKSFRIAPLICPTFLQKENYHQCLRLVQVLLIEKSIQLYYNVKVPKSACATSWKKQGFSRSYVPCNTRPYLESSETAGLVFIVFSSHVHRVIWVIRIGHRLTNQNNKSWITRWNGFCRVFSQILVFILSTQLYHFPKY